MYSFYVERWAEMANFVHTGLENKSLAWPLPFGGLMIVIATGFESQETHGYVTDHYDMTYGVKMVLNSNINK